jgi:hypothetical protein
MKTFLAFLTEDLHLQYHETLNPKIWHGDKIRAEVREKLLRFAKVWAEFAHIPAEAIEDVYFTGGNANYNYTADSDLDVHVVVDKSKLAFITPDREILDDFLKDKKQIWSLTRKPKIAGYTIEPYAQDISETAPPGQGLFSLKRNTWVQHPLHGDYNWDEDASLAHKVELFQATIDKLIVTGPLWKLINTKRRIAQMRRTGIAKGGEFAENNLVFKELRNSGYLQKLSDAIQALEDKKLSL